ncbi:protein-L-isoaspartate O-methyltransferase family protein [Couchioplanes azureus]|uniref:protein-L-isoaspartate O-methyltransferase family protein n=1 Tax=Couchioplanes caeruleus TaxID=56438 RepID=UPI00227D7805|nr:methyltransferase domain-containing protein [Couchioplanes caeruleus]
MTDLRRRFVERIRRDGAPLSPQLSAAFAAVPREAFVADGFQRRDGTWARPGSAGFLEDVYRNDVLVTKVDAGMPVSSSSQPSLMAIMLAALDVRPGDRVLEIGAGTGYNAALLTVLGAQVTTVDVQTDVVERARAALARAGIEGVRVLAGDGYAGAPGERFDRVIVTVGVAGVSPHWLAQTRPGPPGERPGPIVVPVEHAGTHPVLVVHGPAGQAAGSPPGREGGAALGRQGGAASGAEGGAASGAEGGAGGGAEGGAASGAEGGAASRAVGGAEGGAALGQPDSLEGSTHGLVTARVVCPSGFMTAAGPLTARHARSHPHPVPADALLPFGPAAPSRWDRPLDSLTYRDFWYAAGVWSTRATHAAVPGRDSSTLILLDETGTGGAAILPDGSVLAAGAQAPRYAAQASEILDRWESANRPPMHAWRITLTLTGDPAAPIWSPATWQLDP